MPNFFSAFTTDVFRPLATLLIPGAVGVSTWFIALVWQFPSLRDIVTRNHTETGFALLFATVFAGMVFEDLGARYEILLDWWADRRTSNEHTSNWWKYLQTAFKSEPIGRRYARTLVLRLKFELGVACAMISALLGIIWLAALGLSCSSVAACAFACLLFAAWGFAEARETHKVLSKTRAKILEHINIVG
jgi:hypothetical protein